jgi:4-alpha-glucanotransferase
MTLSPQNKIAGVLAPLFALRRDEDLGVGDMRTLREFIQWIAEAGFKLVQLLPINETGPDNSPYNAISAMAIEPTTLDLSSDALADLSQDEFGAIVADADVARLRRGPVKYRRVKKLKHRLLEKAFENFSTRANTDRHAEFERFCSEEANWLRDYSFFRSLMEENHGTEQWDKWRQKHRTAELARAWLEQRSPEEREQFDHRQKYFCYVQWVASCQWREIRSYAESHGVALMGDIPFGVSYYSADVWAQRDQFALDWSGGAPPEIYFKDDEFTQKWGQNWGIPLYRWDLMRSNNFQWWRTRIRGVRQIFHLFRIDHILGFYRIYAFPWRPQLNQEFLPLEWNQMLEKTGGRTPHFAPRDDSNSQNCEANRREGEEYLRVVLAEAGAERVIGEDLGTVPDYVRPSLHSLGIAGFKIPQWEVRDGRVTAGSQYERMSIATYATHDHKPIRELWEDASQPPSADSDQARDNLNKIADFASFQRQSEQIDFEKDFYPAIMEALFKCESWIAVVMITDLLARSYRFNVPGTAASSNWTRRMQRSISQLRSSAREGKRMTLVRELLGRSGRIITKQLSENTP